MAKLAWKKPKERKAPSAFKESPPTVTTVPADDLLGNAPGAPAETILPPLPPLQPEAPAQPKKDGVIFDEAKIKDGLGRAFCTTTQGLANVMNYLLRRSPYRVEFTPVTVPEGDLWAEFAMPVLKMHLPNLEKNPITVLVIMTSLILSGKMKITKLEVDQNAPNTGAEARAEASAA